MRRNDCLILSVWESELFVLQLLSVYDLLVRIYCVCSKLEAWEVRIDFLTCFIGCLIFEAFIQPNPRPFYCCCFAQMAYVNK